MQGDRHDYRQAQEWRSKVHAGSRLDSGSVQHVHARCAARRHLHGGIPGAQARSEVSRPLPAALRPGQTLFKKRGAPPDSISRRSMNGSWPLHGRRRARPLQRRPHTVGRSCRAGTGSARQACNRPLARAVMTEHARAPTSAARGGRPKTSGGAQSCCRLRACMQEYVQVCSSSSCACMNMYMG